jgi:hypothetical protein
MTEAVLDLKEKNRHETIRSTNYIIINAKSLIYPTLVDKKIVLTDVDMREFEFRTSAFIS